MGVCSVSKQSCSNILKGGPGQSITIVVGGAAESLSAHPGTADLTLRKRYVVSHRGTRLSSVTLIRRAQIGLYQGSDTARVSHGVILLSLLAVSLTGCQGRFGSRIFFWRERCQFLNKTIECDLIFTPSTRFMIKCRTRKVPLSIHSRRSSSKYSALRCHCSTAEDCLTVR